MKRRKHSVFSDLSFQSILILMFIAILFLSYDNAHIAMNSLILCVAMVLFIITYFTSIKTGLIMNIIFVFVLIAYVAMKSVNDGIKVNANVYFWMFWPMGMIIAISAYLKEHQMLDEKNEELVEKLEKFTTIDEQTQMNNLLAFERDAAIYMNISRRYGMPMELVLWRLTYQDDLQKLLGKEARDLAVGNISDSIRKALRKEDLIYLVNKDPYIWGTLMFSKPEAAQIVIKHVKDGVASTDLREYTKQRNYSLEMSGVAIAYDGSIIVPLELLNMAKKMLWGNESDDKAVLKFSGEDTDRQNEYLDQIELQNIDFTLENMEQESADTKSDDYDMAAPDQDDFDWKI